MTLFPRLGVAGISTPWPFRYPQPVKMSISMLDHPVTMVLNVFDTLENKGLKVYKFMSIQTQEEHIGHIIQSKRDRFPDHLFFSQAKHGCTHIFPKTENLTLTVVFIYSYVISSSCILC